MLVASAEATTYSDARKNFFALYPNRVQPILRPAGCKSWVSVSRHWPLSDEQILKAISHEDGDAVWGCRWGEQTRFAVLDIDAESKYHSLEELHKLTASLQGLELTASIFRSSNSGGWHIYLFFQGWENAEEVLNTLKTWLRASGYEIRNGVLEVFPGGNGLRFPLQAGFAWLDQSGNLIEAREDLSADEAISQFLNDLSTRASNWGISKNLIENELHALDRSAGGDALVYEKSIDTAGFDGLFSYRLIPEKYQDGREYWQNGLSALGQRHDAVLAVEHYLWHGDSSLGVPALPGEWNDESRYRVLLAWLKEKHNGFCRHINRGNWRKVEAQITRSVKWRRPSNDLRVVKPYPMTERSIERLMALSRATGRTWSPNDLKKGNDGREAKTRAKISAALERLLRSGSRIGRNELARESGCSPNSVSKHVDLWLLFTSGSGNQNPFFDHNGAADSGPGAAGTEEERLLVLDLPGDSGHMGSFCDDLDSSELAPIVLAPPLLLPGKQPTSEPPVSNPSPSGASGSFDTGAQVHRFSGRGSGAAGGLERAGSAAQNVIAGRVPTNSAYRAGPNDVGRAAKNLNVRLLRRAHLVWAARSRTYGTSTYDKQSLSRAPPRVDD